MRLKLLPAGLLLACACASTSAWAAAAAPSDLQARRDALDKLLAEQWEYTLSNAPGVRLHPGRQALERQALRRLPGRHRRRPREEPRVPPALPGDRHHRLPRAGEAQPGADGARPQGGARGGEVQGLADAGQPDLRHPPADGPVPLDALVHHGQGLRRPDHPLQEAADGLRPDDRPHAGGDGRRADAAEVPAREGGGAGGGDRRRRRPTVPFRRAARPVPRGRSPPAEQTRIRDADARRRSTTRSCRPTPSSPRS